MLILGQTGVKCGIVYAFVLLLAMPAISIWMQSRAKPLEITVPESLQEIRLGLDGISQIPESLREIRSELHTIGQITEPESSKAIKATADSFQALAAEVRNLSIRLQKLEERIALPNTSGQKKSSSSSK